MSSDFPSREEVYLLYEPKRGKLEPEYIGPHRIIDTLKNNNVKILYKN